jgi:dGTP triphosphohydrolase
MATITLSYDSKNTSVRKILEGLLNLGLVKEERTIIAESKNEFSEKTLTKEEKQLKKAFADAIILKRKIERGEIKGTSDIEELLNEIL